MVSLCFSGPTYRTHFTPWHLTLQVNQKQFSTHNSILSVVCGWWFFLFLVNSKEKNTGEKAGVVINTELCRKPIENFFSELVTSAMMFVFIVPENFPDSLTCTDHDQDLDTRPTQIPTLSKDVYTSQHSWNKMWHGRTRGWSKSAVPIHHATHFSIGNTVSHPMHISSFNLPLWTTQLEVGMQVSGCLQSH